MWDSFKDLFDLAIYLCGLFFIMRWLLRKYREWFSASDWISKTMQSKDGNQQQENDPPSSTEIRGNRIRHERSDKKQDQENPEDDD